MLETIIAEKSIAHKQTQPPPSSFRNNVTTTAPLKAPVLTPNQRIQGMFKLRTSSPAVVPVEKVLPTPVTAALPTPELDLVQGQLTSDQPLSVNGKIDDSRGSSPPPHGETKLGFKEVTTTEESRDTGVDATLSTSPLPPRTNTLEETNLVLTAGTGDMKGTPDPASTDEQS
jgi:hypothetical protein